MSSAPLNPTSAPAKSDSRPAAAGERRQRLTKDARTIAFVYLVSIGLFAAQAIVLGSSPSHLFSTTVVLSTVAAVVAYGQGIAILTGGIDLSIPWTMVLASVVVTASSLGSDSRAIWGIPLALAAGAAVGAVNGLGIVYLRLAPIVMTLAMNVALEGAVLLYTNGTPKGFAPPVLISIMASHVIVSWIPMAFVFLAAFTVIGVLLLQRTAYGRCVYAVGNSKQVAYLSGIGVRRTLVSVYVISGMCSAIGGMLLAGFNQQSALGTGDAYLLPSIAAVVIGGSSVLGGRGSYLGTLGGTFLLTTMGILLAAFTVADAIKTVIFGSMIIVSAVLFNTEIRSPAILRTWAQGALAVMGRRSR